MQLSSGWESYLGYQWKDDLSSIQTESKRQEKPFSSSVSMPFRAHLSPVSCCSVVETCILPILLYGVENWELSPESISFQGEIAKRILQLPKWYSNTAVIVALGQNSIQSALSGNRFLHRVMINEQSICHRAFSAMVDDVESLRLLTWLIMTCCFKS